SRERAAAGSGANDYIIELRSIRSARLEEMVRLHSLWSGCVRLKCFQKGNQLSLLVVGQLLAKPVPAVEHEIRALAGLEQPRTSLLIKYSSGIVALQTVPFDFDNGAEHTGEPVRQFSFLFRIDIHNEVDRRASGNRSDPQRPQAAREE